MAPTSGGNGLWNSLFAANRSNDRWLRALLDRLPVGLIVFRITDSGLACTAVNRRFEEIAGATIDDLVDRDIDAIGEPVSTAWHAAYGELRRRDVPDAVVTRHDTLPFGNGTPQRCVSSMFTIDQDTVGICMTPVPEADA